MIILSIFIAERIFIYFVDFFTSFLIKEIQTSKTNNVYNAG